MRVVVLSRFNQHEGKAEMQSHGLRGAGRAAAPVSAHPLTPHGYGCQDPRVFIHTSVSLLSVSLWVDIVKQSRLI